MLDILIVCLREGLEAFLIVGITSSCLRTMGQKHLISAVRAGTVTGLVLAVIFGAILSQYVVTSIGEGIMAIIAAFLVTSMLLYMRKASQQMRHNINNKMRSFSDRSLISAWIAVFAFITLMVVREGMEVALILVSLGAAVSMLPMIVGGLLGFGIAAVIAWMWAAYGHRVNLKLFFQVTGIFLWMFTFQLYFYAFHEFCEAGVVPFIDNAYWHNLTEKYGPEGFYGSFLTYAFVIIPAIWIAYVAFFKKKEILSKSDEKSIASA